MAVGKNCVEQKLCLHKDAGYDELDLFSAPKIVPGSLGRHGERQADCEWD